MNPQCRVPYSLEPASERYPKPLKCNLHHISLRAHFNIILPSMLRPLNGTFPTDFPTKILYEFLVFPIGAMYPHIVALYLITVIIVGEE
jgi:hypothetical protein